MLGCILYCCYCWIPNLKKIGCLECDYTKYPFQSPEDTYYLLHNLASANKLKRVRVSGCEPLLNKTHLLRVIRMAVSDGYDYVLDTNGLLLDDEFLASIKPYRHKLYIYMGLKGSTPKLFQQLTLAEEKFWFQQLEALRLVVKHGFTLGVNLMANLTPERTLPYLFSELYKISPILPMTVDMKKCTFFTHNSKRIRSYGVEKVHAPSVNKTWNLLLEQRYGVANDIIEFVRFGETSKAFDRYELKTLESHVEWRNGLKFIKLPEIPFSIPFANHTVFG